MSSSTAKVNTSFIAILILLTSPLSSSSLPHEPDPVLTPWPHQFHSIMVMNYSGTLQVIDLWYDWPNGRNFNIVQVQLGSILYDLEWRNDTSFFYILDSSKSCNSVQLEVGILRPNWLDGAQYLGQRHVDHISIASTKFAKETSINGEMMMSRCTMLSSRRPRSMMTKTQKGHFTK
ncbi:hypothetical protein RchiOBHm_Chr5g0066081 [Rosa chinensis]|uniref:Non-specific serine/threonine protein kinase n=1 Tax=Rosa chinensis TaxID=74649 RepID=A0A2P6QJ26_ROSCH|nr:hypothetical protein RchiOBHm_Chr5g0066081 [Rosa chinensis]